MSEAGGSSPLTRGTQLRTASGCAPLRFIPAYAGNSAADQSKNDLPPVHPRLRGELFPDGLINDPLIGSSPLTRGTLSIPFSNIRPARFIPAYAGNSSLYLMFSQISSVHPRLRGELVRDLICLSARTGSSPLTRGTQLQGIRLYGLRRFIPAYAGNSPVRSSSLTGVPVHPRLRGELWQKLRFP